MKSKKIITWLAVVAIILSFIAPFFSFVFENDGSEIQNQESQTGTLGN